MNRRNIAGRVANAPLNSGVERLRHARPYDCWSGFRLKNGENLVSHAEDHEGTRRDFLYYATAGTGAVAAGAAVWPLVDQMNPSADVKALASIRVDVSGIEPGTQLTVKWLGKPVFIRRRTQAEIDEARAVSLDDLTMQDIAREAGCSVGNLYKRFPSKDDLLVVLVESATDEVTKRIAQHYSPKRKPPCDLPEAVHRIVAFQR